MRTRCVSDIVTTAAGSVSKYKALSTSSILLPRAPMTSGVASAQSADETAINTRIEGYFAASGTAAAAYFTENGVRAFGTNVVVGRANIEKSMIESLASGGVVTVLVWFVFMLAVGMVFSPLGGLLGALIFRSTPPAESTVPPPAPELPA